MPDFLLEIGCEEIPARMIAAAQEELQRRVSDLLSRERLPASEGISHLDTPRRLAVLAPGIPDYRAGSEYCIQRWTASACGARVCEEGWSGCCEFGENHNPEGRVSLGENYQARPECRSNSD
jgi:hypothetical protein